MRKTYIDAVPEIYAAGGNVVFVIEETTFYVPWNVLLPGLRKVQQIASVFDEESRAKIATACGSCQKH